MRPLLIGCVIAAFVGLDPAVAKPSGDGARTKHATQSGLAEAKAARKQRAKKAAEYEPFCVRPFEYPKNAR